MTSANQAMAGGLQHGVRGALLELTATGMTAINVDGRGYAGGKLLDLLEHGDNLRFADIGVVPGLLLTGENWLVSKIPGWYPEVKSSLRRAFCFSELKLAGEGHFFLPALDVSAQSALPGIFGGYPSGVA